MRLLGTSSGYFLPVCVYLCVYVMALCVMSVCVCVVSVCVCDISVCVCYICVYVYIYMCCFCVYVCLCTYVCCLCISYLCVCVCVHLRHRKAGCGNNFSHGWGWDLSGAIRPLHAPPHPPPSPRPTPSPDSGPGEFLQTQSGCDRARVCRRRSVSWQHSPRTEGETPGNGMKASLHKSTGH